LNDQHGIIASVSYLNSIISDISLGQTKEQQRRNTNALVKYSYRNGLVDTLDWSIIYAPYENLNFLKDTLNSDLKITGGAVGSTLNIMQDFSSMQIQSELSVSRSENSRKAPQHFYIWLQAKGKNWGRFADDNASADTPTSREGGHGDLDKVQTNATWKTKFSLNEFSFLHAEHSIRFGSDLQYEKIKRYRNQDSYYIC